MSYVQKEPIFCLGCVGEKLNRSVTIEYDNVHSTVVVKVAEYGPT